MIPYSILSATIGDIDIRILDISRDGFTFRLVKQKGAFFKVPIVLNFFSFVDYRYVKYVLCGYEVEIDDNEGEYYTIYRIRTDDAEYAKLVDKLMTEYGKYVELKNNCDDDELSATLTAYPEDMCKKYPTNFYEIKKNLKTNTDKVAEYVRNKGVKLGLLLDNPDKYSKFLNEDIGGGEYAYIGSQFCHNLFPKENILEKILKKCDDTGVKPVIQLAPVPEQESEIFEKILFKINEYAKNKNVNIEVVFNDIGMLYAVKKNNLINISKTLGILMNKRKKDVRLKYKMGVDYESEAIRKNNLNTEFVADFLAKDYDIDRVSYESCGYEYDMAENMAKTLYLPLYQMNTSSWCTMYAASHNNNRGTQHKVCNCDYPCLSNVMLYPEKLHMLGIYNSLFGIDVDILENYKGLDNFFAQGVDRMVINL